MIAHFGFMYAWIAQITQAFNFRLYSVLFETVFSFFLVLNYICLSTKSQNVFTHLITVFLNCIDNILHLFQHSKTIKYIRRDMWMVFVHLRLFVALRWHGEYHKSTTLYCIYINKKNMSSTLKTKAQKETWNNVLHKT